VTVCKYTHYNLSLTWALYVGVPGLQGIDNNIKKQVGKTATCVLWYSWHCNSDSGYSFVRCRMMKNQSSLLIHLGSSAWARSCSSSLSLLVPLTWVWPSPYPEVVVTVDLVAIFMMKDIGAVTIFCCGLQLWHGKHWFCEISDQGRWLLCCAVSLNFIPCFNLKTGICLDLSGIPIYLELLFSFLSIC
jgi:hypothetical protein